MFADLRPTFPTGSSICLGGGEEEGQQTSSFQDVEFPQVQVSHIILLYPDDNDNRRPCLLL